MKSMGIGRQAPGAREFVFSLVGTFVILRRAKPDEGSLSSTQEPESEILRFAQDDKREQESEARILRSAQDDKGGNGEGFHGCPTPTDLAG